MISKEAAVAAPAFRDLTIKLFADGADRASIARLAELTYISGFTTNPTLMRKAGVSDYESFAREILEIIGNRPISYEVFADDESEMLRQARKISSWGSNVYVKIPITNTKRKPTSSLLRELSSDGIKVNVTALMTIEQVLEATQALMGSPGAYISVFAGRIADTGRDPLPILRESLSIMSVTPSIELIWASPRELLNIFQGNEIGVHVITATADILAKISLIGKDLSLYSLETVQMFGEDAAASAFVL